MSQPAETAPRRPTDTAPSSEVHDFQAPFQERTHDPRDPDPSLAAYLDTSLPLDPQVRAALLQDLELFSRRVLHRIFRPLGIFAIVVIGILKIFIPRAFTSSPLLHKLIHWGLEYFVAPPSNFLILRHFHVGSEILAFIAANAPVQVPTNPIRPKFLKDVEQEIFLNHDLNLYNFIIRLNTALQSENTHLHPPKRLNFDMITDGPFDIAPLPRRWTNFIDLSSAIEVYTPLYQLFLTERDFRRAYHSLQLDETVAIYVARLLGDTTHLALVNNRHPLVPDSAFRSAKRLVLHGLASEALHALLVHHKRRQKELDARGLAASGHGLVSLWKAPPPGEP